MWVLEGGIVLAVAVLNLPTYSPGLNYIPLGGGRGGESLSSI